MKSVTVSRLNTLIAAVACSALLCISAAHADDATNDAWIYKLSPSYYVTTHQRDASDLNLRAHHGAHSAWLGYYRRGGEFEQTRTGYEYTLQLPLVQLVPSLQVATQGFAGGSINAQIGDAVYGLIGLGRTNLRDYYNLNFDPNDSVVYGLGTQLLPKSNLSLFTVRDNRLHTGQVITHAVWRLSPDEHQQWIVDWSSKHGRATAIDDPVSGNSLAVTYDYRDVFVRLARDRKVNFTTEDQTRVTAGLRF